MEFHLFSNFNTFKKEKKINMIYIPAFICDCLIPPINKMNMKYSFYSIDKNFNGLFDAKKNCAVLILNYFGLKNDLIDKLKNNEKIIFTSLKMVPILY